MKNYPVRDYKEPLEGYLFKVFFWIVPVMWGLPLAQTPGTYPGPEKDPEILNHILLEFA